MSGIGLANWNWKAVWQFVQERFGISLSRSSCLNCLHRLGFAFKRPKKRLLKADAEKRDSLRGGVRLTEISLKSQAQEFGAKIFSADEAHFRADAELRCQWVLKGEPALVESTSPSYGEKASYYSAVCLETGESLPSESGGGMDGTGWQQQLGHLGCLPEATERKASWALEGDLGQCASPSWEGDAGIPADTESETATGESAGVQPGLQR